MLRITKNMMPRSQNNCVRITCHNLVLHVNGFLMLLEEKVPRPLSNTHPMRNNLTTRYEQDDQVKIVCTYSIIRKEYHDNDYNCECLHQISVTGRLCWFCSRCERIYLSKCHFVLGYEMAMIAIGAVNDWSSDVAVCCCSYCKQYYLLHMLLLLLYQ